MTYLRHLLTYLCVFASICWCICVNLFLADNVENWFMTQSQMFQKVESDGGPFLKVGFKS